VGKVVGASNDGTALFDTRGVLYTGSTGGLLDGLVNVRLPGNAGIVKLLWSTDRTIAPHGFVDFTGDQIFTGIHTGTTLNIPSGFALYYTSIDCIGQAYIGYTTFKTPRTPNSGRSVLIVSDGRGIVADGLIWYPAKPYVRLPVYSARTYVDPQHAVCVNFTGVFSGVIIPVGKMAGMPLGKLGLTPPFSQH
jgi:hypothetical protein